MLARWRRRLACRTEGGAENRYSLKFVDRGLEAGFAKNNAKQLVRNLRICSLASALTGGSVLVLKEPWDMSGKWFSSPQEQEIMHTSSIMFAVTVSYALVVFAVCCLPCMSQKVPPLAMELTAVFIVCSGIVLLSLSLPYYVGCMLGYHDPAVYLDGRHVTDTGLLMGIDTILTAAHMVLPIRFCVIWPVEVVGVLCYVSLALVFGTAEPENVPQYLAVLVGLAAMAGVGKRNQEISGRAHWRSLIEEKSSRFQAEFQLAKIQEEQEVRTVPGSASAESPSEAGLESVPSTTESARKMMPHFSDAGGADQIDPNFICDITAIGEKEQWLIQPSEMSILPGEVLGEGGFGLVLGGLYQGVSVAIKVPKTRNHSIASRSNFASLCNELRILRRLRHPNIVFLYGACLDGSGYHLALVLELVRGIPLDSFILQQQPDELGRSQVLLDVACALLFLHSRTPHIVHRDLKGSNIFIEHWQDGGADATAKLLDFGLSRMVTRHALPMGGTIAWMAPEILQGRRTATSTETDVFSFGRLAYFVLSGIKPFSDVDRREVKKMLKNNKLPPMQWPPRGFLVERYRSMVEECCDVNPRHRPRMSQVHRKSRGWHDQLRGPRTSVLEASNPFDFGKLVRGPDETGPKQPLDINEHMTAGAQLHAGDPELHAVRLQPLQPGGRLPMVPEEHECDSKPQLPFQGSNQMRSSRGSTSTALAIPQYSRTSLDTVRAMIMEVLMNCNLKVRERDRCCLYHGTLKSLVSVCVELHSRTCSNGGLGPDTVEGQCAQCGVLIRRLPESCSSAEPECAFCGHELNMSHSC